MYVIFTADVVSFHSLSPAFGIYYWLVALSGKRIKFPLPVSKAS